MDDTEPRPLLAKAREAAEELLMRKVAEGSMAPDIAKHMATTGFTVATRILSGLCRDGVSGQRIVKSFQAKLDQARSAGDTRRVIAAEYTLAIWDGMQRDLAAYLGDAGTEQR